MEIGSTGRSAWLWWGPAGGLLATLLILLAALSRRFGYERSLADTPVITATALMAAAGLLYLAALRGLAQRPAGRGLMAWIIAVGVIFRISMISSTPILEDDFYRYLWDGAVTAHGYSPYTSSLDQVLSGADDVPHALTRLAEESGEVARRVNHPNLSTIYPPVTQAAFALAHGLGPWSLNAWRGVLFGFDAATLILLFLILRQLKIPALALIIYWWNPMLIKEIYNSGHMDMVIFPFLLGAVLLAMKEKYGGAACTLALAAGVKVWPVILLPVLLRPVWRDLKRLAPALLVFAAVTALMTLPICLGRLDSGSGFTAYGQRWEMNDALFMLILWAVQFILGLCKAADLAPLMTRLAVLAILGGLILWICRRPAKTPRELAEKCLLAVATLFLLSPTQFPWYSLWLLPFLAIRPRWSLLSLTALLPLYYLHFYFSSRGQENLFHHGIVWIEFIPVWLLLAFEFRYHRKTNETRKQDIGDHPGPE